MSSTAKTNNYNLPIFNATDKPTWMGDFNAAMNLIDTELKNNANGVDEAKEQVDLLEELVDDATATVGTLTARVAASEASVATLSSDVVQAKSDIQTNAVNIAGNTTAINAHSVTITNQASQITNQASQIGQLNERLNSLNESLNVDFSNSTATSVNQLLQYVADTFFAIGDYYISNYNTVGNIFKITPDAVVTYTNPSTNALLEYNSSLIGKTIVCELEDGVTAYAMTRAYDSEQQGVGSFVSHGSGNIFRIPITTSNFTFTNATHIGIYFSSKNTEDSTTDVRIKNYYLE